MARFIINPKVNNTLGLMDVITVPQGGTGVTVAGSVPGVFNAFVGSDLNTANGPIGLDGNGKIPVQYFPTGAGGVLIYDGNGFVPSSAISPSSGVGVFTGITGPSSVVIGETVTYTITNYDSFMNYNVTVSGGSVSVSGNLIAFTAPNTTGTVTLTLNGKTSSIPVIASRVNAPVITAPGNNAEGVSLKPTFTKSAFSVTGQAQTQTSVRWELSTDPTFTTLVDYYEGTSNYTSWMPSVTLSNLTTYYVRVKDQGSVSGYSNWSSVVSFTTVQQVNFVVALRGGATDLFFQSVRINDYIYALGYQSSQGQGSADSILVKYDISGNLIWQRGIGGSSDDKLNGLATDGSYLYAAGYTYSQGQGSYDALVVKYDTNGNLIWQRGLGRSLGEQFNNITATEASIYAVGHVVSNSLGAADALIVKYDTNGNVIWQRALGLPGWDEFISVVVNDVYVYAVGYQQSQGQGNSDALIAKYDTNGNLIWQRGIGGSSDDILKGLATDGSYLYAAGYTYSQGQGSYDALVVKYDTNGNLIWQRGLGGGGDDCFLAIATDGVYIYAAGYQLSQGRGSYDALLVKYDANGNLIWQRGLAGSGDDRFLGITADSMFVRVVGNVSNIGGSDRDAVMCVFPTSNSITPGSLTGSGLTNISWTQPTLTEYTTTLTPYTTTLTPYTQTLTAYTTTLTTYTPTLVYYYSNF